MDGFETQANVIHQPSLEYDRLKQLIFLSALNTKHIMSNEEIRSYRQQLQNEDMDLYRLGAFELGALFGLTEKKVEKLARVLGAANFHTDLLRRLESALRKGIYPLCDDEAVYPSLLLETESAPAILWVYGKDPVSALQSQKITVIGTRRASPYGKKVAGDISRYIGLRDTTVVSGMALGIDGYAHTAALEAGACTIAVLASGVDEIYPPTHAAMYHEIIERGAVVSEHPPGVKATANRFPARNRILAGLSDLTIVVESSMKSGTLITVDFALKYNRDVMVVPGNIFSPESKGCNKLIQTGAMPLIDLRDLDEYLVKTVAVSNSVFRLPKGQNTRQDKIIVMLGAQHLSMNEILSNMKSDPGLVAEDLVLLENLGVISLVRGRYALTSKVESSI